MTKSGDKEEVQFEVVEQEGKSTSSGDLTEAISNMTIVPSENGADSECAVCGKPCNSAIVPSEGFLSDMKDKAKKKVGDLFGKKKEKDENTSDCKFRFQVGDAVKASMSPGEWKDGVVSQLDYIEPGVRAPYQIRLGDGSLVYAPEDTNVFVRSANAACAVQQSQAGPSYRFSVGDKVEAFLEDHTWKPGKITMLNYTEPGVTAAYQIKLKDKSYVYAEDDGEDLVRARVQTESTPSNVSQSAMPMFSPYRFRRGDRVLANMGTWTPGTVIKLNYVERTFPPGKVAPYQILLDNNTRVYAENDTDAEVRALVPHMYSSNGFLGKMAEKAKSTLKSMTGKGKKGEENQEEQKKEEPETEKKEELPTISPLECYNVCESNSAMYYTGPPPPAAPRPVTPHSNYVFPNPAQPAPNSFAIQPPPAHAAPLGHTMYAPVSHPPAPTQYAPVSHPPAPTQYAPASHPPGYPGMRYLYTQS